MINRTVQLYTYATINILWPSAWNMDAYKGIRDIEPVALYFRDEKVVLVVSNAWCTGARVSNLYLCVY